jgi:hypothetical protein
MPIYSPSGGITTYAADTFTRGDSALTLGTSSAGGTWTAQIGTWGINTNQAYCPVPAGGAGNFNVATLPASTSDGILACSIFFPVGATAVECGILARFQDINNFVLLDIAISSTHLYVRQAGIFTKIDVGSAANNNAPLLANTTIPVVLRARGASITASVGSVEIGGTLPPTMPTATGCGLIVANNVDAAGVRWSALSYASA